MKTLISDDNGYKTYLEIRPCINPAELVEMRILTQWDNAKDPDAFQVKVSLILTPDARQKLKESL